MCSLGSTLPLWSLALLPPWVHETLILRGSSPLIKGHVTHLVLIRTSHPLLTVIGLGGDMGLKLSYSDTVLRSWLE